MAAKDNTKKSSLSFFALRVFFLLFFASNIFAAESAPIATPPASPLQAKAPVRANTKFLVSGKFMHISCSKSIRDLNLNRLECFGNVYIRRPEELLTADYAVLDMNTDKLHAEGNIVYLTTTTVIFGNKMDFDLGHETGTIEEGRIENDKFQVLGDKITRVEKNHYILKNGEYSTCRDCPASWTLLGRDVDLTIEGYAFLNNVYVKINEAPSLYLPYLAIPVKTKRQTGLLFPKFQPKSPNGFSFIQPFFWAISDEMDATVRGGFYSIKGPKGEFQYRYSFGNRTNGNLNLFYLSDRTFSFPRWAIDYSHQWELPFGIDQKLSYRDVSDRDYIRKIGDMPESLNEPAVISEASLSKTTRTASGWALTKRVRNILTPDLVGFDSNAVQVVPQVSFNSTDHRVFDEYGLHWGVSGNYTRFWRVAPSFDSIFQSTYNGPHSTLFTPGQNPIRRGNRFNLVPEIYYTTNLLGVFDLIPSVKYRSFFYTFDKDIAGPTTRGFLQTQAELGTNIEKVYGNIKHKFRPSLTYSNIPIINRQESHPFNQQLAYSGYQFDDFDIVPISTEAPLYFTPLGNSLTYTLNNRFIRKEIDPITGEISYRRIIDVVSGETVNFIELRKFGDEARPLSRFFTLASVNLLRLQGNVEYYYYPYINKPTYSLNMKYFFVKYIRRFLNFERSLSLGYAENQVVSNAKSITGGFDWSVNDYFSVNGGVTYRFPSENRSSYQAEPGRVLAWNGGMVFQSPSQCYRLIVQASWSIENPTVTISPQFPINLTGEGFTNFFDGSGGGLTGH